MLLDTVRKTISEYGMLVKGDKVLCAVSGGADSMCLLNILLALKDEYGIEIYVANVNHLIRGEEAYRDSNFVKNFCEENKIEFFYREYDVPAISAERKISEEECGRLVRYEFFDEISKKLGGVKIATAHNFNDNAETVLFRLIRGSSAQGLGGIKYKRDNIIRPLLDVTRKEIEEYLNENNLSWCEDSTNKSIIYNRNKLRNCVMPIFEEISQGAQKRIVSAARLLNDDENYLLQCAETVIKKCFFGDYLLLEPLDKIHLALKRRIVARTLERWGVREVSSDKIKEFIGFIGKENGKSFDINLEYYAEKSYDKIRLCKRIEEKLPNQILDFGKECCGKDWFLKLNFSKEKLKKSSNNIAVFDADKISPPFLVRYRQDGDKIKQTGMQGQKKLSDIFTDEKIEKSLRGKIPIVEKNGEILFVCGIRKSSLYSADDKTENYLFIEYNKN